MTAMLGFGLVQSVQPNGEVVQAQTTISINPFSRDRTLFDSGVAVGRNLAEVPVSGTGTPAEIIEIRLLEEGGAPTAWESAATITEDGSWSATVSSPRRANWMRVEARIQSEPTTRSMTANRFGVGHVIALWGQSEIVRIRSTVHDLVPAEPLLSDDAVQVMWQDGGIVHKHLTTADSHTASLAAMANVLVAERPDDKFAIVFQAVSGTGFKSLVDDSDPARLWSEDAALHAFATVDGQHVGLPAVSWFAAPGALADDYDAAVLPLIAGRQLDGTEITFPTTISYGSGSSYQADHWFGELYDYTHSRWIAYGPHRFDIGEDMQSATVLATGTEQFNLKNKEQARQSWRSAIASTVGAEVFLPLGLEPLTYVNGVSDGNGGWTDYSHPAGNTDDGTPMLARLTAHAILQSAGLSSWSVPEFDQSEWSHDGTYVDVWSSAGPVTTIRDLRAEPPLDDSFAHWTDVFGWEINGFPAHQAELSAGRVRIYPNDETFVAGDMISFGEGGASGALKFPEDFYAQTYKNYPIVDVGAARVDGIPIRPLPAVAALENTLAPTTQSFSTTATGPYFFDTQTLGAGVGQIQFFFDLIPVVPVSGGRMIMTTTGNYLRLEVLPNGALRLRVRDGGGVVNVNNVATDSGAIVSGVRARIALSIDLIAGFARLWVNEGFQLDLSFVSASQELPSNRSLVILATNSGGSQLETQVDDISIWTAADPLGTEPVIPRYKQIAGSAATVNADAWKRGDDAV